VHFYTGTAFARLFSPHLFALFSGFRSFSPSLLPPSPFHGEQKKTVKQNLIDAACRQKNAATEKLEAGNEIYLATKQTARHVELDPQPLNSVSQAIPTLLYGRFARYRLILHQSKAKTHADAALAVRTGVAAAETVSR